MTKEELILNEIKNHIKYENEFYGSIIVMHYNDGLFNKSMSYHNMGDYEDFDEFITYCYNDFENYIYNDKEIKNFILDYYIQQAIL